MLKLMKYEITHSMRTFTTSFLVYLVGCAVLPFAMHFLAGSNVGEIFLGIIMFIFVVLFIGITLALFISIFMNYNRSMFDKPGYLTLTLPKSNLEILISKLIVALIWTVVGFGVVLLGMGLMLVTISFMEGDQIDLFRLFNMIIKPTQDNLTYYLIMIVQLVAELGFIISTIYFAITITHTKWIRKYKMPIAILIFFVLNIFISVGLEGLQLGNIASSGAIDSTNHFANMVAQDSSLYNIITVGINILMCGGFMFLTTYLLNNHIEVE